MIRYHHTTQISCASVIDHVFLELAHQRALLVEIGLAQHLVVEIDFRWVFVIAVVCGVDRARQVGLHVQQRVGHAVAIGLSVDLEIAAAHRLQFTGRSAPPAA